MTAAACLLAALSVTACVLVLVGGSAHHAAPTALESINILSGLGADAAKAIAGMRQLWDGAIPAPAAGAAALPAGTGQPRFQNVDVALNSAGQAALMARQVRSCCRCGRRCRLRRAALKRLLLLRRCLHPEGRRPSVLTSLFARTAGCR